MSVVYGAKQFHVNIAQMVQKEYYVKRRKIRDKSTDTVMGMAELPLLFMQMRMRIQSLRSSYEFPFIMYVKNTIESKRRMTANGNCQ